MVGGILQVNVMFGDFDQRPRCTTVHYINNHTVVINNESPKIEQPVMRRAETERVL